MQKSLKIDLELVLSMLSFDQWKLLKNDPFEIGKIDRNKGMGFVRNPSTVGYRKNRQKVIVWLFELGVQTQPYPEISRGVLFSTLAVEMA